MPIVDSEQTMLLIDEQNRQLDSHRVDEEQPEIENEGEPQLESDEEPEEEQPAVSQQ